MRSIRSCSPQALRDYFHTVQRRAAEPVAGEPKERFVASTSDHGANCSILSKKGTAATVFTRIECGGYPSSFSKTTLVREWGGRDHLIQESVIERNGVVQYVHLDYSSERSAAGDVDSERLYPAQEEVLTGEAARSHASRLQSEFENRWNLAPGG